MLCFNIISIIIKLINFYLLTISLLPTLKAFVPYEYVLIPSEIRNLSSSLLLSAILLTSSDYTQCLSLLNLCCDFSMILFVSKYFLLSLNLSITFITHFFCSFSFSNILIVIV